MVQRDFGLLLGLSWIIYTDTLRQRLAAAGFNDIREPDGVMLRMLYHQDGMSITEIGAALQITKQGASKLIIGLEKRGYVYREQSTRDHRERRVRLTERGEQVRALGVHLAGEIEREILTIAGHTAMEGLRQALTALIDSHAENGSSLAYLGASITQDSQDGKID